MTIENYITALTQIDGLLWQVIGALKAEAAKKMPFRIFLPKTARPKEKT